MKHTIIRKSFVLALAACVMIAFSAMVPGGAVSAAEKAKEKKLKLPVQLTIYSKRDGQWKRDHIEKITYNKKGDITKLTIKWNDGNPYVVAPKYKYNKKGMKVSATFTQFDEKYSAQLKFDKQGRLHYYGYGNKTPYMYYSNLSYDKKGNLKNIKWARSYDDFLVKGTMSFKTTSNGKKAVLNGKTRSDSKYRETRIYNKSGLLASVSNSDQKKSSFSYKTKNGLVTEKSSEDQKIVYSYGKTKATQTDYNNLINNDERSVFHWIESNTNF